MENTSAEGMDYGTGVENVIGDASRKVSIKDCIETYKAVGYATWKAYDAYKAAKMEETATLKREEIEIDSPKIVDKIIYRFYIYTMQHGAYTWLSEDEKHFIRRAAEDFLAEILITKAPEDEVEERIKILREELVLRVTKKRALDYLDSNIYALAWTVEAMKPEGPRPVRVYRAKNTYAPPPTAATMRPIEPSPIPVNHDDNTYAPPPTAATVRPIEPSPVPVYHDNDDYSLPPTAATTRLMEPSPVPIYNKNDAYALPPSPGAMRLIEPSPVPVYRDENTYAPPPTAATMRPIEPSPVLVYHDNNTYAPPPFH